MSATNHPSTSSRTNSLQNIIPRTEEGIQAQLLNYFDSDSCSSLSDPPDSDDLHSPTDSENSGTSENSSQHEEHTDHEYPLPDPPTMPISSIRVRNIEQELDLTCSQADQLFTLMQAEMLKASLLGNLSFHPSVKKATDALLKPILTIVRAELRFLDVHAKKGVGLKRLGELLRARAMILNYNEKHNCYMVRVDKVGKRRDGATVQEEQAAEPRPEQGDEATTEQSEKHPDDVIITEEPPSVATALSKLDIHDATNPQTAARETTQDDDQDGEQTPAQHDGQNETQRRVRNESQDDVQDNDQDTNVQGASHHPSNHTPPSPMEIDTPVQIPILTSAPTLPASYPTALIIRMTSSTTGAALTTTQLTFSNPPSPSYDRFFELASAQLGFNVQHRISAVVPKFYKVAPVDSLVKIESEETWSAVLMVWENMRRRVGEFVVE